MEQDYIFERCHIINNHLFSSNDNTAREELIKLLDFHKEKAIEYSPLINHLIRETGLFPYIDEQTCSWEERFILEAFKMDVGNDEYKTLHRDQSLLLKKLLEESSIAVSAPTSFGKSFVIDAFIKIKNPQNVVIIVPTIALTDETRRRLYKKFANNYKIITTTETELSDKNILIFPQERAFYYVNKLTEIDILIVDEFYKASVNFDKERAPDLVKAIIQLGEKAKQKYFLAPNISYLNDNPFTQGMEFIKLDFNTVYLDKKDLYKKIKSQEDKTKHLLKILDEKTTKTLIYAGTFSQIEELSTILLTEKNNIESQLLKDFAKWLENNYSYNWTLPKLIKKGVGIHNSRLHRSLSQIQVKLFEEKDGINEIISTSSIIEGVNTSAENVIIWKNKNGRSNLNDFTYKNIIGRGGRMFQHFIGKIYILDTPPKRQETQLDIPFPDNVATSLNSTKHEGILTQEQIAKIVLQEAEMEDIFQNERYKLLKEENAFQTTNYILLKSIAQSLRNDSSWNGLGFLNTKDRTKWDRILKKIIRLQPGIWDTKDSSFVEFIKVISNNWNKSIPEQLRTLEKYEIGINEFFQLEKNVTYKLTALLRDLNVLQKEIIPHKSYDISTFIKWCSNAFLPQVIYQLEEYGLPRVISVRIHKNHIIDLISHTNIHKAIEDFNTIGYNNLIESIEFDEFEKYILKYFYDGITVDKIATK
ncbi:DEAD/DEAH box helicase [Elizabethkingia miricola]|uniref:DEAD/DEAH box helicase n=1 Tax=Elizabethkingia miricola TaxID=172045 RepID=UPI002011FF6E|nr:DEAD/DEAH box helicase [Elizabethkingia miricola]MCL1679721.1 DEAD/DEAH box helicase [Elizabethkingia miricola]